MTEIAHEHFPSQVAFASNINQEGSPETEFRQRPDKTFVRKFFNRRLRFPDGAEHEIWSFESETSGRGLPAPLIRVTEGEVVHTTLKPSKGPHTLHWHGIEPDPRNDGVGHTSFEVTGSYTYQWRMGRGIPGDPNHGSAGTYFYHCHVNTVLHVQLGMFGPVIVDPVSHPDYPTPSGTRRVFVDGPLYDVATETLIAPYSVDPRWHTFGHAAGLSGEDVGLNRFEPKHFYILGGPLAGAPTRGGVWSAQEIRANTVGHGYPTLLRTVNANYFPTTMRFTDAGGRPVAMAEIVSHDARALRDTSSPTGPSPPVRDAGRPLLTSILAYGAAERYCILLHPPAPGSYLLHIDWEHWIARGPVLARRTLRIQAV